MNKSYCSHWSEAHRAWVAAPEPTAAKGKQSAAGATASRLALAFPLLFAGSQAYAVNECGAEGVGADSITCTAANYAGGSTYPNYPAGIQYDGSDGLTLTINDAAGTIGNPGVWLRSSSATAGALSVIGTNVGKITTSVGNGYGLYARITNASSTATGTLLLTAGDIEVTGSLSVGLYAWSSAGSGAVLAQMDGGTVTTGGSRGYALLASVATAAIGPLSSTANTTALLTAGDIKTTNTSGYGAYSYNAGLGASLAQMDGGTITTEGQTGFGVISWVVNTSSSALATARLTAGDIKTSGTSGTGVYSLNAGSGAALTQMDGGTITTTGDSGRGLFASTASGPASVNHTGGTVAATGVGSNGIRAVSTSGDVSVSAASSVTGGSGAGMAINTITAAGKLSTINVLTTAVLDAASGIAIQNDDGNSNVTISPGASVTGAITLDTGSDNLTINSTGLSGITVMDGGDDVSAADGWVDTLTLNAVNASLVAENLQNWERMNLVGSVTTLTGLALTTGTGLDAANSQLGLAIDGSSTLRFDADMFAITGDVSQLGTLDLRGAAPGRALNLTGNYYGNGGPLWVNLATADGGDRLNVIGAVSLSGTSLALSGAYLPALGDIFTVVTNDGTDPVVGTFVGLPQGAAIQYNGATLTISYVDGDGNDIVLRTTTAAPLPTIPTLSEWGTMLLGTLLAGYGMLGLRRRQHGGRSARQ
jgi:Extended Signal Peptide of Type V secretion system/IPTL-CTERM motif